ncbi:MAG: HEPN domain-containing protein [Candidatus Methanomethylophilaceae archaeon]|nr:HEPN domain-containing protein [Candidatus Methanomethylophilaceae archaeon]
MRHEKPVGLDRQTMVSEYLEAADEDIAFIEVARSSKLDGHHNICMLAARASEKILKAKLISMGIDPAWTHNQVELVMQMGKIPDSDRALEIASEFSAYAVNANYPSNVRRMITADHAEEAYHMLMEIVAMFHP